MGSNLRIKSQYSNELQVGKECLGSKPAFLLAKPAYSAWK